MIDRKYYFDNVRSLISEMTQAQVDGQNAILDAWERSYSDNPLCYLAYILATAYHESAHTFQPVAEYGRGKGHAYGLPDGPYHQVYYGRGLCQLTHLSNYQTFTPILRQLGFITAADDLVRTPDLALRPDVSAAIIIYGSLHGKFTTKALKDYLPGDPAGARHVINGTDKADLIAGYYHKIVAALRESAKEAAPAVAASLVTPAPTTAAGEAPRSPTVDPSAKPNVFERMRNTFDAMHRAFSRDRT